MFRTKYTLTLLNSKWEPIKRGVILSVLPRIDEFILIDDQYHRVVSVIHSINNKKEIFIVINELPTQQIK